MNKVKSQKLKVKTSVFLCAFAPLRDIQNKTFAIARF
ncbi:MAG: hypothetical protein CLLPBCKN_003556 [Chroococcidiopsis cubana SAG 39.79]|nr:hypothetical protein [Chroococcidiopsis cubana SAG 39.79]